MPKENLPIDFNIFHVVFSINGLVAVHIHHAVVKVCQIVAVKFPNFNGSSNMQVAIEGLLSCNILLGFVDVIDPRAHIHVVHCFHEDIVDLTFARVKPLIIVKVV